MCCTRLAGNTGRKTDAKKSPSAHHRTTLSGCIFASSQLRYVSPIGKKNMLNSNASSTCPDNMVKFGPLTAEIGSGVWGTPANFNSFRVLAALGPAAPHCSSGRQPDFAALNRGLRALPIFGRAVITLGIGPHSNLLLVFHCNYVPVLCRFQYIVSYFRKKMKRSRDPNPHSGVIYRT